MNYEKNWLQITAMCNAIMTTAKKLEGKADFKEVMSVGMVRVLELIKDQIEDEGIKDE